MKVYCKAKRDIKKGELITAKDIDINTMINAEIVDKIKEIIKDDK